MGIKPPLMSKGVISRADLLRFLADQPKEQHAELAALFAYDFKEIEKKQSEDKTVNDQPLLTSKDPPEENQPPTHPMFWRVDSFKMLAEDKQGKTQIEQAVNAPPRPSSSARPRYRYLAKWAALEPRLRTALSQQRQSHHLDIEKLVEQMSRADIPEHLPHEQRRIWGDHLQVIDDRSLHLAPYLTDHAMVQQQLAQLFPGASLEIATFDPAFDQPLIHADDGSVQDYHPPVGGRVLILSDLGCLAQGGGSSRQFWLRFGWQLQVASCQATALLPCSPKACRGELALLYQLLSWQHPASPPLHEAQAKAGIERLLRLLSPALYFQPGLLRAVRLSLGADAPDAAIESLLWQHQEAHCFNHTAAAVTADLAARQINFAEEEEALIKSVLDEMHHWLFQPELPAEVWYEMICSLAPEAQKKVGADELAAAEAFYQHVAYRSRVGSNHPLTANAHAWVARSIKRLSPFARENPRLKSAIRQLDIAEGRREGYVDDAQPAVEQFISVYDQGDAILLQSRAAGAEKPVSTLLMLTELRSFDGRIELEPETNNNSDFWKSGKMPKWVESWGWDQYGAWLEFSHRGVIQRMRWIEAGSFIMGSPDDEPGRWDHEGPQHRVKLTQAYWLFDTPVTQALWQAVMGENPSRFISLDRPVEQVNWHDIKAFLARLNRLKQGLDLSLPTEAQWEYACRAGSQSATYTGDSGMSFELESGYDSSGCKEKQYDHQRADTPPPVRPKAMNQWGLHNMLGNIFEWCEDTYGKYKASDATDPLQSGGDGAGRVVRGGPWSDDPRNLRFACRDNTSPNDCSRNLGFRCVRVQVSKEAEPAPEGSGQHVEQGRMCPSGQGGSERVVLTETVVEACLPIPHSAKALKLTSDKAELTLSLQSKPDWASAIGRDQYGLWVEFLLKPKEGWTISQRMRWIPPSSFMMGVSKSEKRVRFFNERPQHQVLLTKGYWLFDTAVTQALWLAVMDENPSRFSSSTRPVEQVSWLDANNFIRTLNQLKPDLNLSLPSEAQWEYACRANSLGLRYAADLNEIAWYARNAMQDYNGKEGIEQPWWKFKKKDPEELEETRGTHPVALKQANDFGLYDMLGNVWEWCEDGMREYDQTQYSDPIGACSDGTRRVVRGGSWDDYPWVLRSTYRKDHSPDFYNRGLGFRCARVQV